jgi:ferredoxin
LRIDEEKCIACERCIPYCPVNAIKWKDETVIIDEDECYECGVCLRSGSCPVNAFYFPETHWPRTVRAQFGGTRTMEDMTPRGYKFMRISRTR